MKKTGHPHKDLWRQVVDEQRQRHHLALAAECHNQADQFNSCT
ncbi:MAG: hypothetical protein O2890_06450 [Cyanobacteria bacterium]|nr:hypothetical protein [Cyanobacteriota bacterium]